MRHQCYTDPLRCIFECRGACQQEQRQNISCPARKMLIYCQFTKYRGRSRRSTRQNGVSIPSPVFGCIGCQILVLLLLHCFWVLDESDPTSGSAVKRKKITGLEGSKGRVAPRAPNEKSV